MALVGVLNLAGAAISQWSVPDGLWQKQLVQAADAAAARVRAEASPRARPGGR
jgi:hypothetical protein